MKELVRGRNRNQGHYFDGLGVVRPVQTRALEIFDNPGQLVSFHVGHIPTFLLLKLNDIAAGRKQESIVHSDKIRVYPDNRDGCCLTHKVGSCVVYSIYFHVTTVTAMVENDLPITPDKT